jgi:hypothetical protein
MLMARQHTEPAIPPPWRPRRDRATFVISAVVLVLELPILAVLALGALISRAAAAMAELLRPRKRGKIAA